MKRLYSLKVLSWLGLLAIIAVLFWFVVALFIPTYHAPECPEWEGQLYTIRHQELRDNNQLYTDFLLKSVKRNGGYLVLGTSETNARPKGNYYDFLNADTSIHCLFSVIAGAGRTACTYFPLIQSNDNVKNLKVIYFINPAYGCGKLAFSNEDYFDRYVSSAAYLDANRPKNQDVERILELNDGSLGWFDRVVELLSFKTDKLRRKYYQDLVFWMNPERFAQSLVWLDSSKIAKLPNACAKPDESRYNYTLNVSANFDVHSYTLWPHPESTYRCDELRTMIRLCKERGVDVVYVMGPYNQKAYAKVHPDELPKIQAVSADLVKVLKEEEVPYIDCTDLSTEPGVFADWQHHNSYGGYLIYQRIREYVLEKENR